MERSEEYVSAADGARLFVQKLGTDPQAVLISNRVYLFDAFEALAAGRSVIFCDPRNRGRSDHIDDRTKLERGIHHDVDDLEAIRRHFRLGRVDLIGHSYMGLTVALYAMKYPVHVRRVVQIGSIGPDDAKQYAPHLTNVDTTLGEVLGRLAELQKERDALDPQEFCRMFWSILRVLYVVDPADADRLKWEPCDLPNEMSFLNQWNQHVLPSIQKLVLTSEEIAKVKVPVLVIHGRLDRSSPYGAGRDWASRWPDARLVTVENAAHVPWIEAPDKVFGAVETFLGGEWPEPAEKVELDPSEIDPDRQHAYGSDGRDGNVGRQNMTKGRRTIVAVGAGLLTIVVIGALRSRVQGQQVPGAGFAAIPGAKGGQDIFGPYEPVRNWPKPMSESLPNHEKFTWSTTMDVFAESPNRVFLVQKGELARIDKRPETKWIPEFGPGLVFPVFRLPLRQAGAGAGSNPLDRPADGKAGVDWRWEHCIVVVDAEGKIIEDWTQWDKLFTRPHDVEISPYDPEKNVWIVDAEGHAVYKFSHDGKKLLLTLGTPRVPGEDDTHFKRPTFLTFMDANTMYLADGYDGTRVIKYDMNGKKLMQWGQKGTPPRETRPGYFNSVHGIAVDPTTRRVFVNDRTNGRVQVFDENGKYLDEWNFGPRPPMDIHSFIVTNDHKLWAADQGTHKILGYDLNGHFLYSWGSWGEYPGGMWGVHGMSSDQEGNFYVAEVNNGRIQKYRPRQGANPEFLVGKPWKGVW